MTPAATPFLAEALAGPFPLAVGCNGLGDGWLVPGCNWFRVFRASASASSKREVAGSDGSTAAEDFAGEATAGFAGLEVVGVLCVVFGAEF